MKHSAKTFIYVCSISLLIFCSCEQKKEHKNNHVHESGDQMHKRLWNQEDYKAVKAAISDYVEGLYLVDSTRIDRSVDTSLRKLGYYYAPDKKWRDNLPMTHQQLSNLAARWNKNGDKVNDSTPKKIEIFDVNTKTASAKLTAAWGIDYFHLGKYNSQWKIINVIWQSMPENE